VGWMLTSELKDVLAQVRLHGFDAGRFERLVDRDLLGRHRLRLGHDPRPAGHANLHDGRPRVLIGRAPPDVSAPCPHVRLELVEIAREVLNHAGASAAPLFTESFYIVNLGPGIDADLPEHASGRVEGLLQVGVAEVPAGGVPKCSGRSVEAAHARTPRASAVARWTTRGVGLRAEGDCARPCRCMRQPGSDVTRIDALSASLSSAIETDISG
jgi:hypothetical protein